MTGSGIGAAKYVSFTTYRKSGEGVPTPTWITPLGDGRLGFWTSSTSGKAKRLRNDPRVTLRPSDARGRVADGAPTVAGTASLVASGPEFDQVCRQIKAKYGVMVQLSRAAGLIARVRKGQAYGDAVVLVVPDGAPAAS